MIEESKYCSEVMKKYFNIELVKAKDGSEDFQNSSKYWICDNTYVDGDDKVRDHCHVTRKYRGSGNRNCVPQSKKLQFLSYYARIRQMQS